MMRVKIWMVGLAAVSLLGGCATAPEPAALTPVAVVQKQAPAYRWTNGFAPKAQEEATATFGALALRPGDHRWVDNVPATGDAKVVIDLKTQLLYVYRDERLVGVSTISSGKKGKETQLGYWSVLPRSARDLAANMTMRRCPSCRCTTPRAWPSTGGALPGYPASHGCVRLPVKFAERLFTMTRVGTKVVIEG